MLTFVKWKDAKGEFRWTLWAGNHRKVGTSGEGYKNRSDLQDIIDEIKSFASTAVVQDNTDK